MNSVKFDVFLHKLLDETSIYDQNVSVRERVSSACSVGWVQTALGWRLPKLVDLTAILPRSSKAGSVHALSFPAEDPTANLKTPVVAGLFLMQTAFGIVTPRTTHLADGGGVNMGLALRGLVERLGLSGKFFTSRYLSDEFLCQRSSQSFEIFRSSPDPRLSIEEEFYTQMIEKMSRKANRIGVVPLNHVKWGFVISEIICEQLINCYRDKLEKFDHVVTAVGSGGTLAMASGMSCKSSEIKKPILIVPEHEKSIIFGRDSCCDYSYLKEFALAGASPSDSQGFNSFSADRVPHIVLGPHFERKNNRIPKELEREIDRVIVYNDAAWMKMFCHLKRNGVSVGNSSAANIAVASWLATKGHNVLTFIYEPERAYTRFESFSRGRLVNVMEA